jgi:uncharacterized Zn finger protein
MMRGIICPKCGKDTGHSPVMSFYGDLELRCPFCGTVVYKQVEPKFESKVIM